MENFIVSARKYRPSTFELVVGQKSITSTLKNAIKNQQLAQAFLFCGPRGVGKTTCARILAKTINCLSLTANNEACNECISCKSFNELTSFNIHELDAASNNSVDDIRSLVEQVRIPPQAGKYKVYIIDEVHMLSPSAFNAFLKTLEEPPAYAKFILATTEKHKILPTILSRCQIFDFRRITVEDIAHHLAYVAEKENITADADALHLIAQKADGALRDALSVFDQIAISSGSNISYQAVLDNLNILDYEFYFDMTDRVLRGNTAEALTLIDEVIDRGFEGHIFLSGFAAHIRNLLVCKDASTLKLLETSENIKNRYKEFADNCTTQLLLALLETTTKFELDYKNSTNKRLMLELAFIRMCSFQDQQSPNKPLVNSQTNTQNTQTLKQTAIPPAKENKTSAPVKPDAGKNPPVAISASDLVSIKKKQLTEDIKTEEAESFYGNESFTTEALEVAWKSLAEEYRGSPVFFATLSVRKPIIAENNKVIFTVDNKVQVDEIAQRKPELLAKLKKILRNSLIDLDTIIAEDNSPAKPYTSQEKFNKMAEKKPELNKFRDQLNLEIDY